MTEITYVMVITDNMEIWLQAFWVGFLFVGVSGLLGWGVSMIISTFSMLAK